jgi:hypothetical protein
VPNAKAKRFRDGARLARPSAVHGLMIALVLRRFVAGIALA